LAGTTISLERLIVSGAVNLGNVDHIHRRDLYSAARPSRRNGFTAWRSYASAVLEVVILSVCPSVRLSHACFVANPKNLPAKYTAW